MLLSADMTVRRRVLCGIVLASLQVLLLRAAPGDAAKTAASKSPTFENDVLPIFKNRACLACHGPSLKTKELDLGTYQSSMRGSESGAVIVPGQPDESRLYHMVK